MKYVPYAVLRKDQELGCFLYKSVMADALEQSFTLEDLEISELEQVADLPNLDCITTCSCRGHCYRESGRNFCPCKSLNNFCSIACHGENFGACLNNRRAQESDSESSSDKDTTVSLLFYTIVSSHSTSSILSSFARTYERQFVGERTMVLNYWKVQRKHSSCRNFNEVQNHRPHNYIVSVDKTRQKYDSQRYFARRLKEIGHISSGLSMELGFISNTKNNLNYNCLKEVCL